MKGMEFTSVLQEKSAIHSISPLILIEFVSAFWHMPSLILCKLVNLSQGHRTKKLCLHFGVCDLFL